MSGYVVIVGAVQGGHYLEDLQIMVPFGTPVSVPFEVASKSKDFKEAISQHKVRPISNTSRSLAKKGVIEGPPQEDLMVKALKELSGQMLEMSSELKNFKSLVLDKLGNLEDAIGKVSKSSKVGK